MQCQEQPPVTDAFLLVQKHFGITDTTEVAGQNSPTGLPESQFTTAFGRCSLKTRPNQETRSASLQHHFFCSAITLSALQMLLTAHCCNKQLASGNPLLALVNTQKLSKGF